MPQGHEKSAPEYQRVLFKDLWYEPAPSVIFGARLGLTAGAGFPLLPGARRADPHRAPEEQFVRFRLRLDDSARLEKLGEPDYCARWEEIYAAHEDMQQQCLTAHVPRYGNSGAPQMVPQSRGPARHRKNLADMNLARPAPMLDLAKIRHDDHAVVKAVSGASGKNAGPIWEQSQAEPGLARLIMGGT